MEPDRACVLSNLSHTPKAYYICKSILYICSMWLSIWISLTYTHMSISLRTWVCPQVRGEVYVDQMCWGRVKYLIQGIGEAAIQGFLNYVLPWTEMQSGLVYHVYMGGLLQMVTLYQWLSQAPFSASGLSRIMINSRVLQIETGVSTFSRGLKTSPKASWSW